MEKEIKAHPDFLTGGGEMGKLIRTLDWSNTPLGAPDEWPQSLRTTVSIMLNSGYPMFIWWSSKLINIYNDAYIPILGTKHPAAIGQPASEVWSEIWEQGIEARAKIVFQGKPTYDEDLLLIMERKGYKEESYFTFSYSPIVDEQGHVAGLFCACNEETKKVTGERELRTLKDLGKNLSDCKNIPEVFNHTISVLTENPQDFPFTLLYELKDTRVTLVSHSEMGNALEKFPREIEIPATDELSALITRAVETRTAVVLENIQNKIGYIPTSVWNTAPAKTLIVPVALSGQKPYALLAIGLNPHRILDEKYSGFFKLVADQVATAISNVNSFEEERKRAEALAEIDKAKTVFFSNISHEFRTPLTLMLGPLEELLQQKNLTGQQFQNLTVTHRNAVRMQKLVNNLLDFSRIEAGRINAYYEPVNLSAYTIDLASTFRSAIEKAGIQFIVDCPSLSHDVWVDKDMWEKIVLNLLSNAYKYTWQGQILIRLREEPGRASLIVQDSGVGIPANELEKIFERFHRVHNINGRTFEGTGIGLALVKELVKMHEGFVKVESEVDQGTSFTVSIPFKSSAVRDNPVIQPVNQSVAQTADAFVQETQRWSETATGDITEPQPSKERKYILLADDNADMRYYITRLLSDEYDIKAVGDGKAAWTSIQKRHPDLVITDIMMPGMDGFEVLHAVKNNEQTRTIPVVLLSARAGEEAVNEGLQKGADAYLVKPFSAQQLKTLVQNRLLVKASQDKIEENERKFRNILLESPNIFLILKGPQMIIDFVNKPLLVSWGRSWDIIGQPLLEALPEIKDQAFLNYLDHVYKTGEIYNGKEEKAVLIQDGKPVDVYYNYVYQPIFDDDGKVSGITAMATDITEQMVSRQKIEENEKQLQLITDAMPLLVSYVDAETRYRFNNKAYENWFGHSRKDIQGKKMIEILGEQAYKKIQPSIEAVLSGKPVHFEGMMQYRFGGERYISAEYIPHFGNSGEVIGFFVVVDDITERKKSEEALRESEEKYRRIFNSVDEGFGTIEVLFDEKGRAYDHIIIEANPAFEKNSGVRAPAGRKASELVPGLEQYWNDLYASVIKTGESVRVENYSNALQRWFDVLVSRIGDESQNMVATVFSDITQRKLADETIRKSEEKYRSLFETMDQGFCIIEVLLDNNNKPFDYRFLETNPVFENQTGLKNAAGKTALDLIPNLEKHWVEVYGNVALTGHDTRFTEGSDIMGRWFEVNAFRVGGAESRRVAILFTDISDQKKSEKILKESEERFRTMASEAPLFVWVTDEKLQTTFLNKAGLHYFNMDESAQMCDLSWKEYIHPEDLERVLAIMNTSAKNQEPYTLEMRLKNGITGAYRWFLDKGVPRYNGKQFIGFIGTSLDIHDRKEGEAVLEQRVKERTQQLADNNLQLQQQKDFVETVFNSIDDLIAVLDTKGNYISVNKKVVEMYGIAKEGFIGKNVFELFPVLKGTGLEESFFKAIAGKEIHQLSYFSPVSLRHFENFYIPLKDAQNNVHAVLIIGHDTTAIMESAEKLKKANSQLEEKNLALKKSNQELEQFAHIASHDLQEPLRKIQTFVNLIQVKSNTQEEAGKYLDKINISANRMRQLIQDVLNYSRISQPEENFSDIDLASIIDDVIKDFELRIEEKKAVVKYSKLPVVKGIEIQLVQLFSNLLSNSLKFSGQKPRISITAKIAPTKEIKGHTQLDHLKKYHQITFRDNGIGFDQQYAEQSFMVFHRLHERQNYPGTGIGLALVKKIVENHKGVISVTSEVNKGTRFDIFLPQ